MRRSIAAVAFGSLALCAVLGAAVSAQEATSGKHPNDVWGDDYVNTNPILYADLGLGGTGMFTGVVDPKTDQMCYMLNVPGLAGPTAAHIHLGGAGEQGAVVVPLKTPGDGSSGGCVALKPDVAAAILANPAGYYVNVHTTAYPMGATRGQLGEWTNDRSLPAAKPARG